MLAGTHDCAVTCLHNTIDVHISAERLALNGVAAIVRGERSASHPYMQREQSEEPDKKSQRIVCIELKGAKNIPTSE